MSKMWMVRAGINSFYISEFIEHSIVAIGWYEIGELDRNPTREQIAAKMDETFPEAKGQRRKVHTNVIFRFINEIALGDLVVTYDSSRRVYHLGRIASEAEYDPSIIPEMPRYRQVNWEREIGRDDLSTAARNSLGAIVSLFLVPKHVQSELEGKTSTVDEDGPNHELDSDQTEEDVLDDLKSRSSEFIKDRLSKLDPYEVQDLVAGILRAMGYKTRVSQPGADRGADIVASRDGFGFEPPRIVVEVKHRTGAIGSEQIRSFIGGRHKDDKGMYVSIGGFTKDARYEADRAQIPLTLLDADLLVEAFLEHYENLDSETKVLLPLTQIYWPFSKE